jgi:PTH1 family peptidyl-tRNA hydrolase
MVMFRFFVPRKQRMKYLIVGLGNVGAEYEDTRHNIGFQVVEALAREAGVAFELDSHAYVARMRHKGRQLVLIKPTTYMNLSGKALRYWMQKENIPLEHIVVILDDLHLPFGRLRMRAKGSDGGHNGLRHIDQTLGRQDYARLRVGIGNDFHPGQQVSYVLGKWDAAQAAGLPAVLQRCVDGLKLFCSIGAARAMTQVNADTP